MGDLGREISRAAGTPAPEDDENEILEGLYCDCKGTLINYYNEPNELLVAYLNAQYAAGRDVRVISSYPDDVYNHICNIGLHPRILRTLNEKRRFEDYILEELIDDDPEDLRFLKRHDPDDETFKAHMRQYLESAPPVPSPPSA